MKQQEFNPQIKSPQNPNFQVTKSLLGLRLCGTKVGFTILAFRQRTKWEP